MNTKSPSEVALLASGVGSWIQKPRATAGFSAVTMPVVVTSWPFFGETCVAPWISPISKVGGGGGVGPLPLFCGAGAPTVKSAALLSVSVLPFPARIAAVVFESVPVGPVPSKQFAVP